MVRTQAYIYRNAEASVDRARRAAENLRSDSVVVQSLRDATSLLAEVRHFVPNALTVSGSIDDVAVSRLVSYILGFEVEITGTKAGCNDLQNFANELKKEQG